MSVVLLHGVDRDDARTRAMAQGLAEALSWRGDIVSIVLGSQARGDEHFHARFEALRPAWGHAAPTVVIADGEASFAFVRKYRDDLFAYAPVLYCGMDTPDPEYLRQCGDCTGLPETPDVAAAVDLLFRLRPDTRLVVGIMDGSPGSLALSLATERAVAQAVSAGQKHVQVVFPGHEPGDEAGLTLRSLRGVASSIPANGAALFLGFANDAQGRAVDQDEAVRILAGRSSGPVFALSDRWMEPGTSQGIAAAVSVPGRDLGAALGGLVLRIAAGEPAREMLPERLSARAVLDLTVLARFGVPADRLPADALTLNPVLAPDDPAGATPTGTLALAAVLGALAWAWLLLRRRAARKDTWPGPRP
ncbi:MAG: hypothetical protein KKD85_08775 [Proteobacteria bacterium]|uniref:hypothetical protein n=1 Tax=Pseudodesulfovibrio TaxID=2035811 RepID=UPI0001BFA18B|nr:MULTISPECIES: hypothetical protein [Pseudodesulfovibrio]MBU4192396.1 hypothetical protein [Pseudomonadota bacterium]MBU4245031.1 hypothetical protein [Pseudomonadota bacterium]MBU4517428.1 hypothetical protein [Pseudomonadota bacterium]